MRVIITLCLLPLASALAKPNILLIMADDLGFSDLGCYGSEIKTPQLDQLAANGLRYTQFYNTARCWPTRSSILTGFYPQQIGRDKLDGIPRANRPTWAQLLPHMLKDAGYRSYHSGKWHVDGAVLAGGFDRSFHLKDQHRFFNPTSLFEDDKPLPKVDRSSGFYGTTAVTDYALRYLEDHQASHADKPFFAYVAYAAPHFSLHALPEDIEAVGERYRVGWDAIREQRWERLQELGIVKGSLPDVEHEIGPPYHFPDDLKKLGPGEVNRPLPWKELSPVQRAFQADKMAVHAAMIERMDADIGRLLEQLKKMKVYEDTLILFLSDNGASAEIMVRGDGHDPSAAPGSAASHLCLGPGWSSTCNTPFRRHKTWTHEGGACTPLVVQWLNGFPARGELRHDPGHVIDFVPTLLELCKSRRNIPTPAKAPGRSLVKTFKQDQRWNRPIWWAHDGHRAMRVGDWKAVCLAKGEWELYDLKNDRTEHRNLAETNPEKLQELVSAWEQMVSEFKQVAPKPNPKGKKRTKRK